MDKEDARYQTLEQLHERRKHVVRLHRKGHGVMSIVELSGLSYPAVRAVIDRYAEGGVGAIKPGARGRRQGEGRRLNTVQEQAIRSLICDKRPEQLKLDFALWSRAAVGQLILRECGIPLSIRAVGNYLKRWGFTPQKPLQKGDEARPEAVKAWLDEQYPRLEAQAKAERGEIHWGEETALVNSDARGRGDAPRGKTPVAFSVGGTREKLSMISSVTNPGKARWMIVEESFNSDKLIEFLAALIQAADCKVLLILDNLRGHRSKPVKAWLAERKDKIEVFSRKGDPTVPSYRPELNPDERLHADLRYAIGSKVSSAHPG